MENQTRDQQQHGGSGTLGGRRSARDAAFREKLRQMALPLAPLVQLTTGDVHPAFPGTLLSFWLLTDAELEALAHFYHQRTPCRWTEHYPCPITWTPEMPLEEKRRKIGRFIGLRGCESPVGLGLGPDLDLKVRGEEEIFEDARMARLVAADEDEVWRRKLHWY